MTNSTNKPTVEDFVEALPSSNEVIRSGSWIVTNCVGSNHEDKNPSMILRQGNSNVLVICKSSNCSKEELLSYFYERVPYFIESKKNWEKSQEELCKKQLQKAEEQRGR
jgi:hypothetical protein